MRRIVSYLALGGLALALSAGCKSNCRRLSEKLCDCLDTTVAQDSCKRVAANEESRVGVTAEQDQQCAAYLELCACNILDAPDGKEKCGLARPRP
jgi:hypothetical protein